MGISWVNLGYHTTWGFLSGNFGMGGARMCFGGYLGSQSLQYGAVTLFWYSAERHISHLTTLRHKIIKMSISQLNKNGWVLPLFCFLRPVREKSQNKVAIDHPVVVHVGVDISSFPRQY